MTVRHPNPGEIIKTRSGINLTVTGSDPLEQLGKALESFHFAIGQLRDARDEVHAAGLVKELSMRGADLSRFVEWAEAREEKMRRLYHDLSQDRLDSDTPSKDGAPLPVGEGEEGQAKEGVK